MTASTSAQPRFGPLIVAILMFAFVAPTLRWMEFSNSAESLNVATAMEIRRSGNWLIPTLQGETRLAKPPLTAWITATSISDSTMKLLNSRDAKTREYGFSQLAWQTRWPALFAACLTILAAASLAKRAVGNRYALASAVVAASSILLLRYARFATTDIFLTLWVTLANVFILDAIRGKIWRGAIGAGIALGLAMMTKGPVSLVESLLPIAIYFFVSGMWRRAKPQAVSAFLLGIVTFSAIALPWFAIVAMRYPHAWKIWFQETTREGATENRTSAWYLYFAMILYVSPWIIGFVLGLAKGFQNGFRSRRALPIILLVLPLLVMSFAKDRTERYMLPMIPAATMVTAIGLRELLQQKSLINLHWLMLTLLAVGFPIAALFISPPWYAWPSVIFCVAGLSIFIAAARWRNHLLIGTLLVMLLLQIFFISGYSHSSAGRAALKPLADEIVAAFPTAEILNAHPRGKRPPPELGVYLNRTLRWIDNPNSIEPSDHEKVLLELQDHGEPEPAPPAGFEFFRKENRGKDTWWVFVLRGPQFRPS